MFGNTFDFKIRIIEYLDIKTIEVKLSKINLSLVGMGPSNSSLMINGDFIYQLPLDAENELNNFVIWLRERVQITRTTVSIPKDNHPTSSNLSSEIEKLNSLFKTGALSEDEFIAAKKKLLGM